MRLHLSQPVLSADAAVDLGWNAKTPKFMRYRQAHMVELTDVLVDKRLNELLKSRILAFTRDVDV